MIVLRSSALGAAVAALALVLAAVAAPVTADSLSFVALADSDLRGTAASGASVTVTIAYEANLDVATAQHLKLFSRALFDGARQDHVATWTVAGESNLRTDPSSNDLTVATHDSGKVDVRIAWTLPAAAPAGKYTLVADLRTVPTGDSGAAAGVAANAAVDFTLTRTTAGGGGGGGGGAQTPADPTPTATRTPTTTSSSTTSTSATPTPASTTRTTSTSPTQQPPVADSARTTAEVEVSTSAAVALTDALAELAPELSAIADLVIVRDGETGDLLRIEDATEAIEQKHVASDLGFILVEATATGRPVLFNVDTNEVFPVERPAAQVSNDQVDVQDGGQLSVTVQKNTGWIDVGFTDAYPGLPIQGVEAVESDGSTRAIPASLIWRDGGQLHFLDDPTITYTVAFVPAATPPPDQDGFDWTLALFGLGGVVLLAILVGVLVVAGRREAPK